MCLWGRGATWLTSFYADQTPNCKRRASANMPLVGKLQKLTVNGEVMECEIGIKGWDSGKNSWHRYRKSQFPEHCIITLQASSILIHKLFGNVQMLLVCHWQQVEKKWKNTSYVRRFEGHVLNIYGVQHPYREKVMKSLWKVHISVLESFFLCLTSKGYIEWFSCSYRGWLKHRHCCRVRDFMTCLIAQTSFSLKVKGGQTKAVKWKVKVFLERREQRNTLATCSSKCARFWIYRTSPTINIPPSYPETHTFTRLYSTPPTFVPIVGADCENGEAYVSVLIRVDFIGRLCERRLVIVHVTDKNTNICCVWK